MRGWGAVDRRSVAVLALVAALAAGTAGCSNAESPSSKRAHTGTAVATSDPSGLQTVTLTSGVDLRFHPSTIVVHPGRVRIVLVNTARPGAGPPHNLVADALSQVFIGTTQAGQERSVTFTAPAPGTYTFVCSIHATQGQTGRLVVRR